MDKVSSLSPEIKHIVVDKGTEPEHSGCLLAETGEGSYICRRCGTALYRSHDKFDSGCGWPSFDDEIEGVIKTQDDPIEGALEIMCKQCDAHLGHVFYGEKGTAKDTRNCVNSLSIEFVKDTAVKKTGEAIVAAGCFWGVEYYLKKCPGVLLTEVGYIGGDKDHPSYEDVRIGLTGHREAVRVIFDSDKTDYEAILKCFFEVHDPAQTNGQGPDIGSQYQSAIYYFNDDQLKTAKKLIQILTDKGIDVATECLPVSTFWQAELYHQDYYQRKGEEPYCHFRTARF